MSSVALKGLERRHEGSGWPLPLVDWASAVVDVHRRRLAVLRFVASRDGGTTVAELAQALDVTPSAIRAHLHRLEEAGLVEVEVTTPVGPGRPRHLYRANLAAELRADGCLIALLEQAEPCDELAAD